MTTKNMSLLRKLISLPLLTIACTAMPNDLVQSELIGVYCDKQGNAFSPKKICLCIDIVDNIKLSMITYRKGENVDSRDYKYIKNEQSIIVDTKGNAGLDTLELLIKSNSELITAGGFSKGLIPTTFSKMSKIPQRCS